MSVMIWLRGLDLNQRPLGYEFGHKQEFNELRGVVGHYKELIETLGNRNCGDNVGLLICS